MECGCAIDLDYGDSPPSAFKGVDRRAIKVHRCYECMRDIQPGETYRYESGIWDGEPSSYKTCMDCVSMRDTFFCTYIYGSLYDELQDYLGDTGDSVVSSLLSKLTPKARNYVTSVIQDQWDDYYFDHPTQPALRLEGKIQKNWGFPWKHSDWIRRRIQDMREMDEALI